MPLIRPAHRAERDELLALWERSVRATHAFLAEEDILFYRPLVRQFLFSEATIWTACVRGGMLPVGFMVLELALSPGCSNCSGCPDCFDPPGSPGCPGSSGCLCFSGKVEALFVDPAAFRQGVGSFLLRHAGLLASSLSLDVNEQNPGARAFYTRSGFREVGRSPEDGSGRPFPLIHMQSGSC